jgi:type II secretory pathway component GspD/PulD (secretin)
VTLNLYPQVSTITGYLEVNGASYPQVATREAQTTVRIGSGESIVLGGLMRDEDVIQTDKVPILSQIPFLGDLFRHRKVTKTSSQVILTVTPTIVTPAKIGAEIKK